MSKSSQIDAESPTYVPSLIALHAKYQIYIVIYLVLYLLHHYYADTDKIYISMNIITGLLNWLLAGLMLLLKNVMLKLRKP